MTEPSKEAILIAMRAKGINFFAISAEEAAREIDALTEQRVAAAVEHCAVTARGGDHTECEHGEGYIDGRLDAEAAIRAATDRPEDCKRCKGKGYITCVRTYHGEHDETWQEICPDCGGTSARPAPEGAAPIPMVLFCPACGVQHLDKANWESPPHRTHQCQGCGHLWRPASVYTEGVADVPLGTSDTRPAIRDIARPRCSAPSQEDTGSVSGWVLVPREPTEEMIIAAAFAGPDRCEPDGVAEAIWPAMIEAAPVPPNVLRALADKLTEAK